MIKFRKTGIEDEREEIRTEILYCATILSLKTEFQGGGLLLKV